MLLQEGKLERPWRGSSVPIVSRQALVRQGSASDSLSLASENGLFLLASKSGLSQDWGLSSRFIFGAFLSSAISTLRSQKLSAILPLPHSSGSWLTCAANSFTGYFVDRFLVQLHLPKCPKLLGVLYRPGKENEEALPLEIPAKSFLSWKMKSFVW
jgi:hypothetical protein